MVSKTLAMKCLYCFEYGITCKGKPKACEKGPKSGKEGAK